MGTMLVAVVAFYVTVFAKVVNAVTWATHRSGWMILGAGAAAAFATAWVLGTEARDRRRGQR